MIYVITHKAFDVSFLDNNYKVLHVGKSECSSDYLRDDTLNNISEKNPNFCELTGLYWIWKNAKETNEDIIGLVHYRRYFTTYKEDLLYTYFNIYPKILPYYKFKKYLSRYDAIVPKRERIFRTVYKYYDDEHVIEDMDITRNVISEVEPDYIKAFDHVMQSHYYYYANMIVCKRKILDDYCKWLFKIMFKLEEKIDLQKYDSDYQKRVFGFISERLLPVWIYHNKLRVKEFPVYNTESRRPTIFRVNKNRFRKIIKYIKIKESK